MSEQNRELARRIHAAFNERDLATLAELFAPGFISHPLGTTGRAAIEQRWAAMVTRHPDLHTEIEHILVDGDTVAIHAHVQGGDAPAEMVEVFRVEHGQVAELWGVSNLAR
jgi:predicted SnoaL-like aldol condensation-catalyzing enzyme